MKMIKIAMLYPPPRKIFLEGATRILMMTGLDFARFEDSLFICYRFKTLGRRWSLYLRKGHRWLIVGHISVKNLNVTRCRMYQVKSTRQSFGTYRRPAGV